MWFIPSTRWIVFFGIPYHLATFEVMESLCSRFGKLDSYSKLAISRNGSTCMKVKVVECDVKKIPQFIPLIDLGSVAYLIRVCIVDGEENESPVSVPSNPNMDEVPPGKRFRSYPDVARRNWIAKGNFIYSRSTRSCQNVCFGSRLNSLVARDASSQDNTVGENLEK